MTDRGDGPRSSDEMLEEFKQSMQRGGTEPDAPPPPRGPSVHATTPPTPPSPPEPAGFVVWSGSADHPPPPNMPRPRSMVITTQRRHVIAVAIALALVLMGIVSTLVFARIGV